MIHFARILTKQRWRKAATQSNQEEKHLIRAVKNERATSATPFAIASVANKHGEQRKHAVKATAA